MPLHEPFEEKYEILEKIGQGGMGAVYMVRHRLLDELRVVKVIRSPLEPTPEAEERFLREARTACRLRHPNLALLHDFDLGEDGRAYIVLEYIEGSTLRELLERLGPPPLTLALEIARQAALALQYLHRQRIIHRDISPGNLMLTRDFEGGPLVKLIDLGLSRSLESGSDDGLTRGLFVGKVRYASPEQFDEGPVDERSDLYSLGVVLYELVTGRCPISGHDARTWMAAHLFRPPLDFAESDPEGQVPEDLRALILRLLAKSPDARIASAEELAQVLRGVQARFPLRGDELDDVFGGEPSPPNPLSHTHSHPPGRGGTEPEDEPIAAIGELDLSELEVEDAAAGDAAGLESSVSLLLHRPGREAEEESVSIPLVLGAGASARLAEDPSWDVPVRSRDGDGPLYELMDEADAPVRVRARPEPARRTGFLVPLLAGLFSLAIIFTLVALYSVTSEFRLGQAESAVEEVTEPVAPPPAEEAGEVEAAREAGAAEAAREAQPAPPEPTAETPLIEEIAGTVEPETTSDPVETVAPEPRETQSARRSTSTRPPARTAPPRAVPRRTEEPARKVAQALPARREPVVREGGVRPGPGVMPPIPLDVPRFSYPAAARGQGLDIDVRLDLLVDERGKVIDAVVREGDTSGLGFNETALAAARRLTFQPATRGDQPVKMWTEMIFQFSEPAGARRSGR